MRFLQHRRGPGRRFSVCRVRVTSVQTKHRRNERNVRHSTTSWSDFLQKPVVSVLRCNRFASTRSSLDSLVGSAPNVPHNTLFGRVFATGKEARCSRPIVREEFTFTPISATIEASSCNMSSMWSQSVVLEEVLKKSCPDLSFFQAIVIAAG